MCTARPGPPTPTAANSSTATTLTPVMPFTGTLPANRCGFPIDVGVVANNEYQEVTTLPDGTTTTKITGKLVQSFTNDVSGLTIVRNVSGPSTETDRPDGTGTFVGEGLTWFGFGPVSQANTGEPGLVTSGHVVLQFSFPFVTSFSL